MPSSSAWQKFIKAPSANKKLRFQILILNIPVQNQTDQLLKHKQTQRDFKKLKFDVSDVSTKIAEQCR